MFKYLVALILVMHGLAHLSGVAGFLSSGVQAFPDKAWLFSSGVTAHSALGRLWAVAWLAAAGGLVAAGAGLALGRSWWPALAGVGAGVSLLAIVPWLRAVPPGAWAGATLDVVIAAVLLSPWAERLVRALA